ncbi:hypothetical protein DFH11DRAFT_1688937 [Phellopilus nigrolimitatus]|nr:hypothetical protein DFH11DRAFT_1688937 [Phellopilus nigrolimitatus]
MFSTSRVFCTLFAALAALFSLASALPLEPERRDVWVPQVTYPHADIVWKIGYRHNVSWDLSSQPAQITNPIGQILLRKDNVTASTGPGSTSEPLASGFDLTLGRVEITVPDVTVGCGYQVVLFGDSGNFSPNFIIAAEGD